MLTPTVINDDAGVVRHARLALFDDADFEGASLRYWATTRQVIVQSIESSNQTRGRAMLAWLRSQTHLPVRVVEAIPAAYGFWDKMKAEGLIADWEAADGQPSCYERQSRPWPALGTSARRRPRHR